MAEESGRNTVENNEIVKSMKRRGEKFLFEERSMEKFFLSFSMIIDIQVKKNPANLSVFKVESFQRLIKKFTFKVYLFLNKGSM